MSAVVNALVALGAGVLPFVLELVVPSVFGWTISFDPSLPLWIVIAGFGHSLGMLGLYEAVWWWDHLTHTISAGLVATALYAAVVVTPHSNPIPVGPAWVGVTTVWLVLLVGVFWELLESLARAVAERYSVEPLLVQYGPLDTTLDLFFDLLGAVVVVAADLRLFVPFASRHEQATEWVLHATVTFLLGGLVLLAVVARVWLDGSGPHDEQG
ncbi:hypothetical protein VB773_21350 [Haloarculaceae archaeon H-GB2-1]|nr:hypothetical protein [Haloarculaceae archaeon H-GB11]MEA5409865.1 hypothetical protein [Haloarculaceae archaeon H-GB2-1]